MHRLPEEAVRKFCQGPAPGVPVLVPCKVGAGLPFDSKAFRIVLLLAPGSCFSMHADEIYYSEN